MTILSWIDRYTSLHNQNFRVIIVLASHSIIAVLNYRYLYVPSTFWNFVREGRMYCESSQKLLIK